MRLSPHELDAVCRTLYGADPNGRVWLFGSRADDSKRGGDIDLYLEASQPIGLKTILDQNAYAVELLEEIHHGDGRSTPRGWQKNNDKAG